MRGRAPSREPARPLKLPQPGPLLNIVGRTSDWLGDSLVLCFYGNSLEHQRNEKWLHHL